MPDQFPLVEPTKEQDLAAKGVSGEETLTERTTRNLQERATAKAAAQTPDKFQQARDAQADEQERLAAEHGILSTTGANFARGLIDIPLSGGALAGAGLEALGDLTDIQLLHDFGRDVGRASTSKNAFATGAAVFGGGDAYRQTERDLDEQSRAWPMLSTVSRNAGMLAGTIASGGAISPATVPGRIAAGAVEGGALGAQSGYDQDAPLRDVLSSTLLGAAIGGGLAGAGAKVGKYLASPEAKAAFTETADVRAGKAIGLTQAQINQIGDEAATQLGSDVATHVLEDGTPVFPKGFGVLKPNFRTGLAERIGQMEEQQGAKLGSIREQAGKFIESNAPELRPNATALLAKMREQVVDRIASEPIEAGKLPALNRVLESIEKKTSEDGTIALSDLLQSQKALKGIYRGFSPEVAAAKTELKSLERMIEDEVTSTVDRVAPKLGSATAAEYTATKRLFQSAHHANESIQSALGRSHGNNLFPLTSQIAGAAELAGAMSEGEGAGLAGAKGLAIAALHKYVRNNGSLWLSKGARALAAGAPELGEAIESAAVPVAAAGGREAQQVISYLSNAQRSIGRAVEAAGDNPELRLVAQRDAADEQSQKLHERAGQFDPASWQSEPTPIQKVVFRSQILNRASEDLAGDVSQALAATPGAFSLEPDRLTNLVKDGNGPLAIGGMQQGAKNAILGAPPTPTGEFVKSIARDTLRQLGTADTAQAMALGHALASGLRDQAAQASDPVSADFANRQAQNIEQQLGSDAFGSAGRLYARATPAQSDEMHALSDPQTVREELRTIRERGKLPDRADAFSSSILDAYDARAQLTGDKLDGEIRSQLESLGERFAKAERAVTLDGGPVSRVLDFFSSSPDRQIPKDDPRAVVTNAIAPHIQGLLPFMGNREKREMPETRTHTTEELQSLYDERLDTLSRAAMAPDGSPLASRLSGIPNIPPGLASVIGSDAQQRMQQLLSDLPKPTPNIRGKAFETLSSSDLQRANAMWEATMDPRSVFRDFARGNVDYVKVQYAWKQYPGMQRAAQAGLIDALQSHLSEGEREDIPDSVLTQLDYMLGFDGRLQGSIDASFSARISSLQQPGPKQNPPGGQLATPFSKPTFTQRIAGARG